MTPEATDTMDLDKLGRLEDAARERWGESWTLDITLWADDTQQHLRFTPMLSSIQRASRRTSLKKNALIPLATVTSLRFHHKEVEGRMNVQRYIDQFSELLLLA